MLYSPLMWSSNETWKKIYIQHEFYETFGFQVNVAFEDCVFYFSRKIFPLTVTLVRQSLGKTHIHILFGVLICIAAALSLFLKHHFLCLLLTDQKLLSVSLCHLALVSAGLFCSIVSLKCMSLLLCAIQLWPQPLSIKTFTIITKSSMCRKLM